MATKRKKSPITKGWSKTSKKKFGSVGSKKRKKVPSHVFAMPKSRKYPFKVKRGGRWVVSRKGVASAFIRSRQHGATGVATKMRAIQRRNGWLPKGKK